MERKRELQRIRKERTKPWRAQDEFRVEEAVRVVQGPVLQPPGEDDGEDGLEHLGEDHAEHPAGASGDHVVADKDEIKIMKNTNR